MILAALALAGTPIPARVDALAAQAGLAGEILIAKGDTVLVNKGYGPIAPGGMRKHRAGQRWRLASITKQVTAAMVVARVAAKDKTLRLLDQPIDQLWGDSFANGVTRRQLLSHHTGLANPDATPAAPGEMPAFYKGTTPNLRYCFSKRAVPGAPFAYNNCDYLIAYAMQATDPHFGIGSWPAGMSEGGAEDSLIPGFVHGKAEPAFNLATFGAAGGLTGTARAVFDFDRALMTDRFMPRAARDELWKPEGNGSYQALGQWVFPGKLKGCAAPKRIVQRDGEIGGVQARNFILPDDDVVVIVFTNRGADDFAMGEVWQGKGFTYDLLSAVACP